MIGFLIDTIKTALTENQFLSGGLGLMVLGSLGYLCRSLPSTLWGWFLRTCTIIVDIQSTDHAYDWILFWLNNHPYSKRTKRLSVRHVSLMDDDDDSYRSGQPRMVYVPSRGHHLFTHRGRLLWLQRQKEEQQGGQGNDMLMPLVERISLRLLTRSRSIMDTLITEAREQFEEAQNRSDIINLYRYNYGWCKTPRVKRPLSSIVLPSNGQDLVTDIQKFVDAREWYVENGIPHRRGYLFYGPPGTGKSCTVLALASEFDFPIYILNLAGMSDTDLEGSINKIETTGPAILLMEDIDTVYTTRDQKENQKLSLGTLLNAIDGVYAKDNIVLIMTTNRPTELDEALVRKGRVDRRVEFGFLEDTKVDELFTQWNLDEALRQDLPDNVSMSDVQELIKQTHG